MQARSAPLPYGGRAALRLEPAADASPRLAAARGSAGGHPGDATLSVIRSPAWESERVGGRQEMAALWRPGDVVGVCIGTGFGAWTQLSSLLGDLQLRMPAATRVLVIEPGTDPVALSHWLLSGRRWVRGVIVQGQTTEEELRAVLTAPGRLAEDVVGWLPSRGIRLHPAHERTLFEIFSRAPAHPRLQSLLREIGVPLTTIRSQLAKKLLPSPSRWHQAARALHAVVHVQAHPGRTLGRIADDLRFPDATSLSHLLWRVFRVRATTLRATLGWEWLLDRWIDAPAIAAGK